MIGRDARKPDSTTAQDDPAKRPVAQPTGTESARSANERRRDDERLPVEDQIMSESLPQVYLARHGETAWTISRQHTGRTDIPLTARGEANARSLGERLKGETFELVFVSPLGRARRTCELAGFGAPSPSRRPTCWSGTTARTRAGRRPRSAPSDLAGICSATALPGRVGRGGRCPGRPRRGSPQTGPRTRHPLRPWPLLPRSGRALAGPPAGGGAPLLARHRGTLRTRL